MFPRGKLLLLQGLVAAVAIAVWHIGASVPLSRWGFVPQALFETPLEKLYLLPKFFFSTPGDVALRIWKWFSAGTIWRHLSITQIGRAHV